MITRSYSVVVALLAFVSIVTNASAQAPNCAQYNGGNDPSKSFNLQVCCSSYGPGGSFATADAFCQANPAYFVTFNNAPCNNPCAPPSTNVFASGKVFPYIGWQRGTGAINICVDPQFSSASASAITSGAQAAFTAIGLSSTVINNLTDSRCARTNAYKEISNAGTSGGVEALTHYDTQKWNSNYTAEIGLTASTTYYMGYNPTQAQLKQMGTHEALHTDGNIDDYTNGCGSGQTYMWFQGSASPSNPPVPAADTCADARTIARTSPQTGGGTPPTPPAQPPVAPPGPCNGSFYCPNSTAACGSAGWYCTGGESGCSGSTPSCASGTVPICSDGSWSCTGGCDTPEPTPCCSNCYEYCDDNEWVCEGSPIVLDIYGTGFHFTDIPHGVKFKVLPEQQMHQMSWPDAAFHNGWLALDRNGDGKITDFTELFGNATPQPSSGNPNGYLALAVFDNPSNGGNGNGVIDPGDAIFHRLLVWIDENHNGISEPGELHTLPEAGVFKIDLHYFASPYVDENGNQFRYKSRIWDRIGVADNVCYDVFVKIASY